MSRQPVRALFFDVGGTLLHPWPSVGTIYASVINRHGVTTTAEAMESAFRESWSALKRPGLTVSCKDWWREVVFHTLGQKNEVCFEELFEIFARPEAWRIFPDVEDTLREARSRGLHVGVISNWDERLRPLLDKMALAHYFDSMTISCEVGAEKPDAEIFHAGLRAAGVMASESIHVGDSYKEDVKGAEALGIAGVLLDRGSSGTTSIRSLYEIWTRVGEVR